MMICAPSGDKIMVLVPLLHSSAVGCRNENKNDNRSKISSQVATAPHKNIVLYFESMQEIHRHQGEKE